MLDENGSRVVDADESYWHRATGGIYAPPDLRLGQQLLLDLGLVEERDRVLYPRPELATLVEKADDESAAALTLWVLEHHPATRELGEAVGSRLEELVLDPARREEMLLALGRRFDDSYRRLLGEIGEEVVLKFATNELTNFGYPQLAARVRRISLDTDQTGYDITAPRIIGSARLLEVKSGRFAEGEPLAVHLSRNEFETGMRYKDWALVVCRITDVDGRQGEIVGWTPGDPLSKLVPADRAGGRWETALITLDPDELLPGLPPTA
ncbi:MAG: protein NO VEIN domain-containing protein [Gaiellaceae bacterium]